MRNPADGAAGAHDDPVPFDYTRLLDGAIALASLTGGSYLVLFAYQLTYFNGWHLPFALIEVTNNQVLLLAFIAIALLAPVMLVIFDVPVQERTLKAYDRAFGLTVALFVVSVGMMLLATANTLGDVAAACIPFALAAALYLLMPPLIKNRLLRAPKIMDPQKAALLEERRTRSFGNRMFRRFGAVAIVAINGILLIAVTAMLFANIKVHFEPAYEVDDQQRTAILVQYSDYAIVHSVGGRCPSHYSIVKWSEQKPISFHYALIAERYCL